MRTFVHTIAVILFFASCSMGTAKVNGSDISSMVDSVGSDYTANAAAIEQKKLEMLAVADSVGHFWFSDDTEEDNALPLRGLPQRGRVYKSMILAVQTPPSSNTQVFEDGGV